MQATILLCYHLVVFYFVNIYALSSFVEYYMSKILLKKYKQLIVIPVDVAGRYKHYCM